jgi:hypothetical protein
VNAHRFSVGDAVRCWKPGHAEHGAKAIVGRVLTIEEYGGPASRGPHAYSGWGGRWGGALPDAMVVSEAEYQAAKERAGKWWAP